MKIWMSKSAFLKHLGSVTSGLKCRLSTRQHVGATVSVLCDILVPLLCSFPTSSHNSDSSGGSANNSWSMSACNECCNCDVVKLWVIVSIMRARSRHCFQRRCRCFRCKHLRLSAPVGTIEVLQNKSGLFVNVFLLIDRSRLCHSFATCRGLLHSCHDIHFSQRVQLLLSSLLRLFGTVKDCQDFVARSRHSKDSFPQQSRRVCSPCSTDTNPRSPLA